MASHIEHILEFWFGTFPSPYTADSTKADMWFKNGRAYDQEIFTRFALDYEMAIKGELDHWLDSYRGRLALIILLDQFSRHIHRDSAQSFAQDSKAQVLCLDGIASGDDKKMHVIERSFFYLPLEHAEDIEKQMLSIKAYTQLAEDVPEQYRKPFEMTLSFAERHQFVINKFGRFPELNEILGRTSTADELAFIASGKYSFL